MYETKYQHFLCFDSAKFTPMHKNAALCQGDIWFPFSMSTGIFNVPCVFAFKTVGFPLRLEK